MATATKTAPAAKTAPAKTAEKPAEKPAAAAFSFANVVAAAVVVAVPTAADRARAENPLAGLVAGMLHEGKPVAPGETDEEKARYAASARVFTVPGGLTDEPAKKASYFLNQAGNALNVTVRKNVVAGKDDATGEPVTQFTIWCVERQKRERKS